MCGQERQEPQFGRSQRRRAGRPGLDHGQSGLKLRGSPREVAEIWPLLEDVVNLHESRCGAARVGECDVGVGHFDKCLDRNNGQGVGEQRPQPRGTPKVEPGL